VFDEKHQTQKKFRDTVLCKYSFYSLDKRAQHNTAWDSSLKRYDASQWTKIAEGEIEDYLQLI
jgi:hypothetical protein